MSLEFLVADFSLVIGLREPEGLCRFPIRGTWIRNVGHR